MEHKERLIELFKKYGFEYRKRLSNNSFLAFTYRKGFFNNAELVSLGCENREEIEKEMDQSIAELEKLDFSTKKTFFENIESVEKELFEGFFNVKEWKEKIRVEYEEHVKNILKSLPDGELEYGYIQAPYTKNSKIEESDIIQNICQSILVPGPQLLIIEAPAGFGKTCTSYEILNELINNHPDGPIPFFTEFSRDRQAKVFSHIFVREVDRSFSSVNSSVVIDAVKDGSIVVVLDGFDELLQDSGNSDNNQESFESAEPMLETISELLTNNAKVVLTSRRSAIFDGDKFHDWVGKYDSSFQINRFRIRAPNVEDWLTTERVEILEKRGLNIKLLANPVLLSYLRFSSEKTFKTLCSTPETIVDHYFESMLNREMERQGLRMSAEKQTILLKLIASDMCEENYTSTTKDKMIALIKEKASVLLNEVRSLYPPKDKPSLDGLATILSNHAFFDRGNSSDHNIQFVNEFVFGNYVSKVILDSEKGWMADDERFVEPAVLSYSARPIEEKKRLWEYLELMRDFLDPSSRMRFEAILNEYVDDTQYTNTAITSVVFDSISMFNQNVLEHCLFNKCTFQNVNFYLDNFDDVTFLDCSFWDCSFELTKQDCEIQFYHCNDNNDFVEQLENTSIVSSEDLNSTNNELSDIEYSILETVWPVGASTIPRLHFFIANFFKNDKYKKRDINKALKSLRAKGIFLDANDNSFIEINKHKVGEIKEILKRGGQ